MRPIKFRAWDKKNKKMFGDFYISADGSYSVFDDEDGGKDGLHEHDISDEYDLEIMQFTGLLDKNGKEIWEGDIVRTHPGTDKRIKFLDTIEKIEFKNGSFIIDGITSKGQWNELYKEINRIEVIGNIFENPELLK